MMTPLKIFPVIAPSKGRGHLGRKQAFAKRNV